MYALSIPEYRSTNSVYRKIEDLRTSHPDHAGTATRGGRLSAEVARAFVIAPEKMHLTALTLRSDRQLNLLLEYSTDALDDEQQPLSASARPMTW